MENLNSEIEDLLAKKLKVDKASIYLLMSKPLADIIGIVPNPKEVAAEMFMQLLKDESIPLEIREHGVDDVCFFLMQFNYTRIREVFMTAATAVKANLKPSKKN